MIAPGSVVVVSLRDPREQVWGVLKQLDERGVEVHPPGVTSTLATLF